MDKEPVIEKNTPDAERSLSYLASKAAWMRNTRDGEDAALLWLLQTVVTEYGKASPAHDPIRLWKAVGSAAESGLVETVVREYGLRNGLRRGRGLHHRDHLADEGTSLTFEGIAKALDMSVGGAHKRYGDAIRRRWGAK